MEEEKIAYSHHIYTSGEGVCGFHGHYVISDLNVVLDMKDIIVFSNKCTRTMFDFEKKIIKILRINVII